MVEYIDESSLLFRAMTLLDKIFESSKGREQFDSVYPMTTENLAGYFKHIDVFSSVLCVGGSGDHALNCALHGAKYITMFDCNPMVYFLFYLKKVALWNLPYQTYIKFFTVDSLNNQVSSSQFFSEVIYNTIRCYIDDSDVRLFWDTFYTYCKDKKLMPYNTGLFRPIKYTREKLVVVNDYLHSEDTYKQLSRVLNSVKFRFIDKPLVELFANMPTESQFNLVLFSNISDYLTGALGEIDEFKALDKYNRLINEQVLPHMAYGGRVYFAYIYQAKSSPKWTAIDYIEYLPSHFDNYKVQVIEGIGQERYNIPSSVDCVLYKVSE